MMLKPETRHLLTDALRPPSGFQMDLAVGTTYSLNLTSLILAPLAMAAHDATSATDDDLVDPIALLESVRRYAGRTTVFAQAGAIHVPSQYKPMLSFAEDSVVQVRPATPGRVFHPKVWILRFVTPEGETTHRFVCLSRNLTMDRSWDTVLQMDQADEGAETGPITSFLHDLPSLSLQSLTPDRAEQVADLARTIRRVRLEVPAPFKTAEFWPLGTPSGRGWPFPFAPQSLVAVTPFLDPGFLNRLPRPKGSRVVSRAETFDRLGAAAVPPGLSAWVLQRAAETNDPDEPATSGRLEVATGLHAKTFVWDTDRTGHVFTGSANGTGAAFGGGNVEFSVLLTGPQSSCGTAAILEDDPTSKEGPGLARLMQEYEIPNRDPKPDPALACEMAIEAYHAELAAGEVVVAVEPGTENFTVSITTPAVTPPLDAETTVRPIGRVGHALPLQDHLVWRGIAEKNLSPFVALETTLVSGGVTVRKGCVVKGTLVGAPSTRGTTVLRSLLANERDLLRYLALLLGDPALDSLITQLSDEVQADREHGRHHLSGSRADDLVVFEPLIRAAGRRDGSLKRVESLLTELADEDGRIPHLSCEFMKLWDVVWTGAKELQP